MADIQTLLTLLKDLDDQLTSCMRCGMCQAVCPIYAETGKETDVARGKIALLEGLAHEMVKDPFAVQDRVESCLLCGSCAANCPSGVKTLDIFLKARAVLAGYLGLSRTKRTIFRGMLAHPGLMNSLMSIGAAFQGLFVKPVNEIVGTSCARFNTPGIGDRHFPALAGKSLHASAGGLDEPAGKSGLRVAFYYGCAVDKVFPKVGLAALKVLKHHGVGVFMPKEQACCGIPALSSGDRQTFDALVAANLDYFGGASFDYLITPCATCTSTIKKIWPAMCQDYPEDKRAAIAALAAKTMDLNAFLVDKVAVAVGATTTDTAKRVTIHDPCHLKKSLGVATQPRALIKANPAYSLVEMREADACCGCGGSYTLSHVEMSRKIGKRKRDAIVASGAEVVAAGCPACMLQIMDVLSREGDQIAVKHPIELYAETLG